MLYEVITNGFEKATGVKLNYKIVERRAGDIEKIWADTTYANEELGWKAEKGVITSYSIHYTKLYEI